MKKNIHAVERVVRIAAGVVLVSMAFIGPANLWFLLGLVPLMTGLLGRCPPYAMCGISTCRLKDKK
ncbi:DUF2892 domain-containing protein [Bdellovibrio sp.]|uniref:YgaP family membrane protein n=1 Tax=Bdellovibrio TaxID=958 RepID=UPI00322205C1